MPVVTLASLKRDTDKQFGDLKIAMTDEVDADGEPVDYVALIGAVRLGKERRAALREQIEQVQALTGDSDEVIAQRHKIEQAQEKLDGLGEDASKRVVEERTRRLADEQQKLDELTAEDPEREEEQAVAVRGALIGLVRTVARSENAASKLIEACKTEDAPDGDVPYLMSIFQAYMERGEPVGEASPSES